MTNDSQFVQVKTAVTDLFKQIDNKPSFEQDKLKEKLNNQFAEIAKVIEQANAEINKYTTERDAIKTEQLNTRITKLDAFCKAHKGTSFDILSPHIVKVDIHGETYSVDVRNDEYLDSNLQKIDNLLKIGKQLDDAGVSYNLRKGFGASLLIYEIRIVLDEFDQIVFDFTIEKDDTVKLKAEYMSDSLEYIKRQIDPFTTFEVEVGTRDHEEFYVTITSTNHCKLRNIAFAMPRIAGNVSDNIDFEAE